MDTLKFRARRAGILYLIFALFSIVNEFFLSAGYVVPGNAAATMLNIMNGEQGYRMALFASLLNTVLFVLAVASVYSLFRDVDRDLSLVMVMLVSLGMAVSLVSLTLKTAPLIFMSGTDYLAAFTKEQLEALSMGFLRVRGNASSLAMLFWGLWLFPFGALAIKSKFVPKIFGILLLVAGLGYVVSSFTSIVLPDYRSTVSNVMMPLYFGEVPVIFWMIWWGWKREIAR